MYLLEQVAPSLTVAAENSRLYQLAAQAASTDPLTGLNNRREFEAALADEVARARRYGRPLSLVMIDVDSLKTINDGRPIELSISLGTAALSDDSMGAETLLRAADQAMYLDRAGENSGTRRDANF